MNEMRICVVKDCMNLAHRGFRKCLPCIKGIKPTEENKEEEE
tara:strand:+ start:1562 stop:1687 length:126 start_codon:yes stop_codon:yes gene_type:complete